MGGKCQQMVHKHTVIFAIRIWKDKMCIIMYNPCVIYAFDLSQTVLQYITRAFAEYLTMPISAIFDSIILEINSITIKE